MSRSAPPGAFIACLDGSPSVASVTFAGAAEALAHFGRERDLPVTPSARR